MTALLRPRHEYEMLDTGSPRLVDDMLETGRSTTDSISLRHRLRSRQKSGAQSRHGEHGFYEFA